jgi:hypothetical protein
VLFEMDDAKRASFVRDFLQEAGFFAIRDVLCDGGNGIEAKSVLDFAKRRRAVIFFRKFFDKLEDAELLLGRFHDYMIPDMPQR